ncbi:PDZ domain-containing protein [Nocardioides scoriae]|uniref:endopeptidase La n=1 Tax=Nocardioides scoriae TaxID=642780 RepID=A0A1H1XIQ4_9ACTN|nr:PDZ domain-containing protein [Nocardioides scoriae]SDT09145.1 PDZ domain-containing protein [Nocardioides scoriae]
MPSRRTAASLLALALVVGLAVVAWRQPVPYVTFAPGPTVNVLGDFDSKPIIKVTGRETYDDDGGLRLVTVVPSGPEQKVPLPELVSAWLDPDRSVYPYEAIYGSDDTRSSVRQQSAAQMTSSQENAVAAALKALGIGYDVGVGISLVQPDGPADGKLEVGDQVLSVDGRAVDRIGELTRAVRAVPVGDQVALRVRRDGRDVTERMRTVAAEDDPQASAVRVGVGECCFDFPFDVQLQISQNIGGPSGGLMFATGIYDVLTPGSLTDGKVIAGTGEIDPEGNVGEIGGIQQKLVGAQADGARLFLVPAGNCAEALGGNYDPDRMRLVKVSTLDDAISDVKAWAADPDADLPRCTR